MSVQVSQVILYRQQSIMQQCMESNPAWRFHCNHGSVHIEYVHAKHKKSRENINSSPPPEKDHRLNRIFRQLLILRCITAADRLRFLNKIIAVYGKNRNHI